MTRDLVEHAIEFLRLRVALALLPALRETRRTLGDRCLALRDDFVHLVAVTRSGRRPRRRARAHVVANVRGWRHSLPQLLDAHMLGLLQIQEGERDAAEVR